MFLIIDLVVKNKTQLKKISWIIYSLNFKFLELQVNYKIRCKRKRYLRFIKLLKESKIIIGYNIYYLLKIINNEYNIFFGSRNLISSILAKKYIVDIQSISISLWNINQKKISWPKLFELYNLLFKLSSKENTVLITANCFLQLINNNIILREQIHLIKPNIARLVLDKPIDNQINKRKPIRKNEIKKYYYHIHNHSSYSILNSTIDLDTLVRQIVKYNMEAIGLTDSGNMMGIVHFIETINSYNNLFNVNIKPIIGCEFYLYNNNSLKKYHPQVLIAKNLKGYYNLVKLCSLSYIEGYDKDIPIINFNLIKQYKGNLIALSSDINSEISSFIKNNNIKAAEKKIKWWLKEFGNDFYLECFRHGLEEENKVNKILLKFSKKYKIPYLVQNNNFYINKEEAEIQEILVGLKPVEKRIRLGLTTQEHYVKSQSLMYDLFKDFTEGFKNLNELLKKIECFKIVEKRIFPKYYFHDSKCHSENTLKQNIEYFENKYLKSLVLQKLETKYKFLRKEIKNRISFELRIIETINYPGYFLIVNDLIKEARNVGILVGPGRGSVVGSLVSYCLGITTVDPVKYDLLFERFLNKSRFLLPDIDIDFEDKGRDKIIIWLINKYGGSKVSQIITYGTLGSKSALRDAARVLDYPFKEINPISKIIPNFSLNFLFRSSNQELITRLNPLDYRNLLLIKRDIKNNNWLKQVVDIALKIEGNIKTIGIHACGILITPYDIRESLPIIYSKSSNCLVTQYEKKVIEQIGLLKIDILGLKTLSIIKDTIKLINKEKLILADINHIPITDPKTLSLFQSGKTTAVFQYESSGIQNKLKQLNPRNFDDLIIMTALYRPGPFKNLNNYIYRHNGLQPITYELADLEEYLKETKGIIIYQEQVMLITQKVSNFNKAEADILRQAISTKNKDLLDSMKARFIEGGLKKGHLKKILSRIWEAWENFASYAFNKSHSASYTLLSFQTGYLKSHFPVEYMSSVLNHNMQNIKELSLLIKECQRMGLKLLRPNINISDYKFIVSKNKFIRYGLGAIKGIGKTSIKNLLKYRNQVKPFTSILDIVKSVNLRLVNKKVLEKLVLSGAFDVFKENHRAQYFVKDKTTKSNMIEKILSFGIKYQQLKKNLKNSLFKEINDIDILEPTFKNCKKWNHLEKLNNEKEVLGLYLFSHPIDKYQKQIKQITNLNINKLKTKSKIETKLTICGMVSQLEKKKSKNNRKYIFFTFEDKECFIKLFLVGQIYYIYKHLVKLNNFLIIDLIIKKNNRNYLNKYFYQIISIKSLDYKRK
ncbi:DNA polymerase III subunit alpha [Candidatus Karelsulcia muelleri]